MGLHKIHVSKNNQNVEKSAKHGVKSWNKLECTATKW